MHIARSHNRFRSRHAALLAAAALVLPATVESHADIIRVPQDVPTIQAGINAARDGDEVVIADGIYTGEGNRDIEFSGKAIIVRSESGPKECIVDCEGSLENPHRGFAFRSGEGTSSVLSGLTIRNGFLGARQWGGAINVLGESTPLIVNCRFENNSAERGGAIRNARAGSIVVNCVFVGNTADLGGAVYNGNFSHPDFANCTFTGNEGIGGGGVFSEHSSVRITNCILWENTGGELMGDLADASYSCVQGGYPGIGIIDEDPRFLDVVSGDLRLNEGSPCIDAGDNDAVPPSVHVDLDGNPRFFDDPNTEDTGHGQAPIVDMGAYEFQADLSGPIPPQHIDVVQGKRLLGGLLDLNDSDDRYLIVQARRPTSISRPSIEVVLEGVAPIDEIDGLFLRVELAALLPVPQWVDLYDFENGRWERFDEREATPNDTVLVVSTRTDAQRFVDVGTSFLRARVSWYDPGVTIPGWTARIDQAVWTLVVR